MALVEPVNKSICLEQVCASNYRKLFRLIPDLTSLKDGATGLAPRHSDLRIRIIERTPYTLTIELSHCFNYELNTSIAPAVTIRIYLDAQLAEVLNDSVRAGVSQVYKNSSASKEIMNYKWRLNYFLLKWLDHCLATGYCFNNVDPLIKSLIKA